MIPGKIGQSEPRFAPPSRQRVSQKMPRCASWAKKRFSRAYWIDVSTFPAAFRRLLPRASCAGIIQLDLVDHRYLVRLQLVSGNGRINGRIITYGARSAALTHDYKSVMRLQPKNVLSTYHREEEEDFVPLPWQVISAVPQRTGISSALPANRDGRRVRALRGGDQQAG